MSDAVTTIAHEFAERGMIDSPDDIRFLYLEEIRASLTDGGSPRETIAARMKQHAEWSSLLPPERIGAEEAAAPREGDAADQGRDPPRIIRGDSGTHKNARGRIYVGFPKDTPEDDVILVLEHGEEVEIHGQAGEIHLPASRCGEHLGNALEE